MTKKDRPRFDELVTRLLPAHQSQASLTAQCGWLSALVYRRAMAEIRKSGANPRRCPVSDIDVTHQGMPYPLATTDTIKRLFKTDRPQFDAVLERLGLSLPADTPMSTQCGRVNDQISRLADAREF